MGEELENRMKYRGYTARIEFDEVDRIFVGHLAGIMDIVGFHPGLTPHRYADWISVDRSVPYEFSHENPCH